MIRNFAAYQANSKPQTVNGCFTTKARVMVEQMSKTCSPAQDLMFRMSTTSVRNLQYGILMTEVHPGSLVMCCKYVLRFEFKESGAQVKPCGAVKLTKRSESTRFEHIVLSWVARVIDFSQPTCCGTVMLRVELCVMFLVNKKFESGHVTKQKRSRDQTFLNLQWDLIA